MIENLERAITVLSGNLGEMVAPEPVAHRLVVARADGAVCLGDLEGSSSADREGARNGDPIFPSFALAISKPRPRGAAGIDDFAIADHHPIPACKLTNVTFAPADDGAFKLNM